MPVDVTPRKSVPRGRAALLETFAPNTDGDIQAQDFQDLVASTIPDEAMLNGDFWVEPSPYLVSGLREIALMSVNSAGVPDSQWGGAARGWIEMQQHIDGVVSFGAILYLTPSGTWNLASASVIANMPPLGLALDNYTKATSEGVVLRRGVVYHTQWRDRFKSQVGCPVYLHSGGSISVAVHAIVSVAGVVFAQMVGYVERPFAPGSMDGASIMATVHDQGVMRFEPQWALLKAK